MRNQVLITLTIREEDMFIWEAYNYKCVAHPERYAVCLHEEPPKSLNPRWKEYPDRRFPVCNQCHNKVHSMTRESSSKYLEAGRKRNFPKAEAIINAKKEK